MSKQKVKRKEDETGNGTIEDDSLEADRALQQIQLMKMQLQFERQRREVHAERNRRLLGKLRDSRELEEKNSALVNTTAFSTFPFLNYNIFFISVEKPGNFIQ